MKGGGLPTSHWDGVGIFCLNRFTKKARTERDDGRSDGRLKEAAFCRGVWLQAFWTVQIW